MRVATWIQNHRKKYVRVYQYPYRNTHICAWLCLYMLIPLSVLQVCMQFILLVCETEHICLHRGGKTKNVHASTSTYIINTCSKKLGMRGSHLQKLAGPIEAWCVAVSCCT